MYNRMITLVLCFTLALPCPVWAADATDYQQVLINTSVSATTSTIPVGTVITWPVSSNPPDWNQGKWLECNGQSTAGYPELAAVVGANVPNYQGMFLRGYGGQYHYKWNGDHNGNSYTYHYSEALGVIQGDATRHITGMFSFGNGADGMSGCFYNGGVQGRAGGSIPHNGYDNPCFTNSFQAPIAHEIRPVNVAVRYLIRARP